MACLYLSQCMQSSAHVKVVTRHKWGFYVVIYKDIRHALGMQVLYLQRKEMIELIFRTAKENHGFHYAQIFEKIR